MSKKRQPLNAGQALCLQCQGTGSVKGRHGGIHCKRCGSTFLVDRKSKQPFVAQYDLEPWGDV